MGSNVWQRVQQLAQTSQAEFAEPIVLVSFVRAGVPLGCCFIMHCRTWDVTVCIMASAFLRDRGIDFAALKQLLPNMAINL